MSFRSICRLWAPIAGLSLILGLGACGGSQEISKAWNGAGWYLEKPYLVVLGGPRYFGGPFSYDKCEEERIKLPAETATQMLCVEENRRPDRYGFF
ncbi:MAG TPA: hypothetical protein VF991_02880 [Reyranella sp.]|jgi:hypothetical protein